jgi:glucokinase
MTNPRQCGCGRWGCLEAYASATSVAKRTLEALEQDGGKSPLHDLVRQGQELTAKEVFDAAAAGDVLAGKIVEDTAFYLGVGAMNMMHTIDPDTVAFAGGMIAAGEPFLERIRYHVKQLAFPVPAAKTQIQYAQLGNDAGFIGAAACARLLLRKK